MHQIINKARVKMQIQLVYELTYRGRVAKNQGTVGF